MPFTNANWSLLESIDSPADVRKLNGLQLKELARQLREFLLDSVSSTGGHLSAGLGTIELTVAAEDRGGCEQHGQADRGEAEGGVGSTRRGHGSLRWTSG